MFEDDHLKETEYQTKDSACPEIVDLDLDHNIIDTCQGPNADEQGMDLRDHDKCPKTVGKELEPCQGIHADEHSTACLPGKQKDHHNLGEANQDAGLELLNHVH